MSSALNRWKRSHIIDRKKEDIELKSEIKKIEDKNKGILGALSLLATGVGATGKSLEKKAVRDQYEAKLNYHGFEYDKSTGQYMWTKYIGDADNKDVLITSLSKGEVAAIVDSVEKDPSRLLTVEKILLNKEGNQFKDRFIMDKELKFKTYKFFLGDKFKQVSKESYSELKNSSDKLTLKLHEEIYNLQDQLDIVPKMHRMTKWEKKNWKKFYSKDIGKSKMREFYTKWENASWKDRLKLEEERDKINVHIADRLDPKYLEDLKNKRKELKLDVQDKDWLLEEEKESYLDALMTDEGLKPTGLQAAFFYNDLIKSQVHQDIDKNDLETIKSFIATNFADEEFIGPAGMTIEEARDWFKPEIDLIKEQISLGHRDKMFEEFLYDKYESKYGSGVGYKAPEFLSDEWEGGMGSIEFEDVIGNENISTSSLTHFITSGQMHATPKQRFEIIQRAQLENSKIFDEIASNQTPTGALIDIQKMTKDLRMDQDIMLRFKYTDKVYEPTDTIRDELPTFHKGVTKRGEQLQHDKIMRTYSSEGYEGEFKKFDPEIVKLDDGTTAIAPKFQSLHVSDTYFEPPSDEYLSDNEKINAVLSKEITESEQLISNYKRTLGALTNEELNKLLETETMPEKIEAINQTIALNVSHLESVPLDRYTTNTSTVIRKPIGSWNSLKLTDNELETLEAIKRIQRRK